MYTDTVRLLEVLAKTGLLDSRSAAALADAYRRYRRLIHHLTLRGEPRLLKAESLAEPRQAVADVWQQLMCS